MNMETAQIPEQDLANRGNLSYINENLDKYWKLDELTTFTPEDMLKLVKQETGREDIALPRGAFVLMKLYTPAENNDESSFKFSKELVEDNARFNTRVGKVLAWGGGAFVEKRFFPAGATCDIGHYALFNKYENQNFTLAFPDGENIEMALVPDTKIIMPIANPQIIDASRLVGR